MTVRILVGDCRERMAGMEAGSVQCVVTSPPYFGLRDYNVAGQIGLEPTLAAYIATMVDVFRAVRRVLRDDGTVWLNIGDSYTNNGQRGDTRSGFNARYFGSGQLGKQAETATHLPTIAVPDGLKPKDLMMVPARLAIALQDDGWYLRSDIIWAKPNPMPESVTDRPTSSHEHIFLLTKRPRYYFDAGTTLLVADRLGRNAVGIELNPTYAAMTEKRVTGDAPLFAAVTVEAGVA